MARRRPPRGRRPPARARLACLAALLALAALAALPTARAQLATEDLYDPEAPADADGTADGAGSLDANATEADYGGTGDGTGADSVEPPPSYEEIVRELLNPTEEEVVAEPPPSLDLNALGRETVFPDSPFVGDGVSDCLIDSIGHQQPQVGFSWRCGVSGTRSAVHHAFRVMICCRC